MIHLETERLILRNYTADDAAVVHEYFSHEEVARYEDFHPMTMAHVEKMVAEWADMDNRMLAVLKSSGEVLGSVGYWIDEDGDYSIDYDFNPRFWRKGYATEAAREVVRHLVEDKGVREIYGDCDARNAASAKVMDKLGFEFLFKDENGSYKDDADGNPIVITVNVYKLTVKEPQ